MATSSNNGVECQECNEVGVGGIDESVAGPSRGSNVLSSSLQEQNQVALSSTSNAVDPVSNQERDHEEDVMNPSTFVPMPIGQGGPAVYIEYCDRCRWAPRASWISTELFLTFPPPAITSITLQPTLQHGGRFRIWLDRGQGNGKGKELVWDRKVEGGFPELKILKQRIRDHVRPEQNLGHSDADANKMKNKVKGQEGERQVKEEMEEKQAE